MEQQKKQSIPVRVDADEKVSGNARYVDDVHYADLLHAATVRTTLPGGVVRSLRPRKDFDWSGFVLVTSADIPGDNVLKMIERDQPLLVSDRFRHAAEAVALLAHPDPVRLAAGMAAIELDEEAATSPPLFDIDEALAAEAQIVPGNIFTEYRLCKGETAAGEAAAAVIVEGTYHTPAQEHLYIEPQGMVAQQLPDGGLRVAGSMQCPYYVLDALVVATGLPHERIQVIQTTTGGGFGGKEDYPSMIACHAALLALKADGRPVKLVYDRGEDLRATPKRHPSRTNIRLGADAEGRLTLIDIDFALDGGAYVTLSPVVLSRGVIHAPGPYRCDNISVLGRAVATNHPPFGAFRGFGAPQSIFAMEAAMDRLADALGLDPCELRRRNLLRSGDTSPTGDLVSHDVAMHAVLDQALQESNYQSRRSAHDEWNRAGHRTRRGIGIASFAHGSGFTGNGELNLRSRAGLRASSDGRVEVLASTTEIGQGMATTFAQIAATALNLPLERVRVAPADTTQVPNSGPTVASRTCMVVGRIVQDAAKDLISRLRRAAALPLDYTPEEFAAACHRHYEEHGPLVQVAQYKPPLGEGWNDETFSGPAYAAYAWATYVADIEIDLATLETRVIDFVAVQEVGRAIHPIIAAGQIEGGVAQGIGYALYENTVWANNGLMANDRLTDYIIPTSADLPPIRVYFQETAANSPGPAGAKGLGELPMDGPAPAIANAVRHALGVDIDRLPILPERLLELATTQVTG